MPRTKLQDRVDEAKRGPVWERNLRASVDYALIMKGLTKEQACEKMDIPRSTFFGYQKEPAKMPLGVFIKIVQTLGIPAASVARITGAKAEE
ncbi:MAG: hypothetical protein IKQ73_07425 [Oscillospiraceae bacterium]|nr:hypothetical protein [Oscillospiraceae bacterium]